LRPSTGDRKYGGPLASRATGRPVGSVSWYVEVRLDRFGPDDVAFEAITVEN
jgi:hypothetical protein